VNNEVWIVDDEESIRWVLERALKREAIAVRAFGRAEECLQALAGGIPRVLVSDIRMPGESGIELLARFRERAPATPVIIMTAHADLDSAVAAFQGGAFEYLPKPFDLPVAVELIRRAIEESRREPSADGEPEGDVEMLGRAGAMQEVFRAIGRLSGSTATVLITGDSGTGKELVARALHRHSPRANGPFVALNTAAIPRELLESELFGHERGAFTGAVQMRRGRFEQAAGGTLFLDEIGDMPAALQTRLLRVLSDGQFYRVGGHQPLTADCRVIAATNQDLEAEVRSGEFREDLLHRLDVIRLRLPRLRERGEDIALLANHFMLRAAREHGVAPKKLGPDAITALERFDWPGNVRQLQNVCNWLTVMAPSQVVTANDLPPEIRRATGLGLASSSSEPVGGRAESAGAAAAGGGAGQDAVAPSSGGAAPGSTDWRDLLAVEVAARVAAQPDQPAAAGSSELMAGLTQDFEAVVLRAALAQTGGRRIEAARLLGIGRNTISRKIAELGLDQAE